MCWESCIKTISSSIFILLSILFYSVPTLADSLRCGDRLIKVGDTKYKVLQRCGQPNYRERLPPYGIERQYSP
ncbi:MAG: DUF2845 domain-containing protein [Pseudomonadota bacterium]